MSMCPDCGAWESKTLETRKDTRFNWRWRRRRCLSCSTVYSTYEIPADNITEPTPTNPDGRLER